jgi:hypothetical protein
MLKKKIVMLIAAALMTLSASSAFAAFGDLELIRIAYDRNGSEIATDLGLVSNFTAAGANNTIPGSFAAITPSTSTFVTYFALDRANNQLWATGSTTTPSIILGGASGLTGLKNGTTPMYAQYNTQGGTNYIGAASLASSYKTKLSANGQQGALAAAINLTTRANTEVSLASIASTPVSQGLYFWANGTTTVAANKTGVLAATITTNSDGSATIISSTPAPVASTPIPPAFFLMGSGLLGMFGLRRKTKVA